MKDHIERHVDIFYNLYKEGKKTLDDIPVRFVDEVRNRILEEDAHNELERDDSEAGSSAR